MIEAELILPEFAFSNDKDGFSVTHADTGSKFSVKSQQSGTHPIGCHYSPDLSSPISPKRNGAVSLKNWEEVVQFFKRWLPWAKEEIEAVDLWAEAAKTAQLFTPNDTLSDDKFTRNELAEVQGQLRILAQSFASSALPEAAKQKLIELTHNAAVAAETVTKRDWVGIVVGSFTGAVFSLALNPTQANEVIKLVKAAFGGLFLN